MPWPGLENIERLQEYTSPHVFRVSSTVVAVQLLQEFFRMCFVVRRERRNSSSVRGLWFRLGVLACGLWCVVLAKGLGAWFVVFVGSVGV